MNSKRKILKVLEILAAVLFIGNGLAKLIDYNLITDFLAKLNYNRTATVVIGLIEVFGAIGLLFKESRFYVSAFLILLMVGAIGSTVGAKMEFSKAVFPSAVLVLLAAIAYYDNFIAAEEEEEEIEHRNDLKP
jgi:putative oxidoreductase